MSSFGAHALLGFGLDMTLIMTTRTLGLALLLLPTTTLAQQTLLDQQPSHAFSLIASQGVESCADDFIVGAGGTTLDEVTWWGTWGSSGNATADTFDVIVHDNAMGGAPFFRDEPGAVIASFLAQSPVVTSTGATVPTGSGPLPEYRLELTLVPGVDLAPGHYWVELYSTGSSGSPDIFSWEMAPRDIVNGVDCMSWSTSTPGTAWNSCTPFPEDELALLLSAAAAGDIGSSYCGPAITNSTGFAGEITAQGSTATAANNLTLTATSLPPGQFGYFLSAGQMQGFFNPPMSQGFICLAGNIGRFDSVPNIIQGPTGSIAVDLTSIPVNPPVAVMPGETWNFQCWYRDVNPSATSNFTDGVSILFL